jgi:MYXO-CTERM domain-containing protein
VESVEEDPFNTVRLKNTCDFDIEARSVINCSDEGDCEVFYFASGQESLLELEGVEEVVTDFDENPRPERFLEIAWAENGLMGQVWLSSTYQYDYLPAPPCDDVRTCQVTSTHTKQPTTLLGWILLALAGLFGLQRRRRIT